MFDMKYDADGKVISTTFKEQPESVAPESLVEQHSEDIHEISEPELEIASEQEPSPEETPQNTYFEEPVQETNKERNMRALRESREQSERERLRVEKERDEALRRARELEDRYNVKHKQTHDDSDDIGIGEDDLVEGKHVKMVAKQVNDLKKQLEYYKQQAQQQTLESRIRSEFPDFEKVVTPDNIAILKHLKPRQAALLDSSNDMYATAATAYEMIKEYGIYQSEDVMNKKLVHKNTMKPKPTASISPSKSESPLTRANAFASKDSFSPELAKQLQAEMNAIRKSH